MSVASHVAPMRPEEDPLFMRSLGWEDYKQEIAARLFGQSPPDSRDERWRYSRAQDFIPPSPTPVSEASAGGAENPCVLASNDFLTVESERLCDPKTREHLEHRLGLSVWTLKEAWEKKPEILRHALAHSPVRNHYFTRWNTVHVEEGYCLHVSGKGSDKRPLALVWNDKRSVAVRRLVLVLEADARLDLVETEAGFPGGFRHVVREVSLHPRAILRHVLLDSFGDRERWIWTTGVSLDAEAHYRATAVHAGNLHARHELCMALEGADAHATLNVATLLAEGRVFDLQTEIRHQADRTESRQLIHAAAAARARSVYGGSIVVDRGTHATVSHQQSRGLLLDRGAEIDSRPELRIHSDDVRCTHGASLGELDPTMLFYLQSRGLEPVTARAILLQAFALHAFDEPDDPTLLSPVTDRVERLVRHLASRIPA